VSEAPLRRRLAAEALGTGFLLVATVGSGAMAESLAGGNAALALLANAAATAAALAAIILVLAPVSGAHLNPAVTLALAITGGFRRNEIVPYVAAQLAGAIAGVALANLMFEMPALAASDHTRSGASQLLSEGVAAFGLIVAILGCLAGRKSALPAAVALYIGAAYWFTASTSFANPAATLARALTPSFAGIAPADVPAFVVAQLLGAGLAAFAATRLWPASARVARPD
jgi:glycerol uptake facilitator-like aquaporin